MIGTSLGAVYEGIEGTMVRVEADVSNGLPQFAIVGLPDSAVSESKLRIRSAIRNAGLEFPSRRITINLSPASVRKRGAGLDLAIAIAILRASGQLPTGAEHAIGFAAELSLSGQLGAVPGLITLALAFQQQGLHQIAIARPQYGNCVPIPNITWMPFASLGEVVHRLRNPNATISSTLQPPATYTTEPERDFMDVTGLDDVKRALTIAAAGHHHVMLVGPPGCGKTMLGERLSSILPQLTEMESLEVYAIHQACGDTSNPSLVPPTRIPHHTLSTAGMVGGGTRPVPGEVTMAHRGVLLLDEVLEFQRPTLDALREPIVQKRVRLSRAGYAVTFPADFLLIGTLNPCPCGYKGFGECTCLESAIVRYWSHLSGALMDRVDMFVQVPLERWDVDPHPRERSSDIRNKVGNVRAALNDQPRANGPSTLVTQPKNFQQSAWRLMRQAVRLIHLSGRAATSVATMSQTIAALDGRDEVSETDVSEALALRAAPIQPHQ